MILAAVHKDESLPAGELVHPIRPSGARYSIRRAGSVALAAPHALAVTSWGRHHSINLTCCMLHQGMRKWGRGCTSRAPPPAKRHQRYVHRQTSCCKILAITAYRTRSETVRCTWPLQTMCFLLPGEQVLKSGPWGQIKELLQLRGGAASFDGQPLVTAAGPVTVAEEMPDGAAIS
jgi:hypothetical protein